MKWKHTIRKINEVVPQEKNPRKITKKQKDQLRKSLDTFGIAEPICITKEGIIIGGHQRYFILKSDKAKEIPCWECQDDLSEAQLSELTIRLNKNTASWDYDLLANSYDITNLLDWGFDLDDLEIEEDPEQDKPKSFEILLSFPSKEDLENAERHLQTFMYSYHATYKVKIK